MMNSLPAVVAIGYYGGVGSLGHFMKIVGMPNSKFDVGRWMFDVHGLFVLEEGLRVQRKDEHQG